MSLHAITTAIQKQTGMPEPTGKFNEATAIDVVAALDFDLEDLIEIIQRKVGTIPDGIYGSMTGRAILHRIGLPDIDDKEKPENGNTYTEVYRQTPNYTSGTTIKPAGVVLHHSYGSYNGSVSWILQKKSKVSYHVIIDTDGSRTVFAPDNKRCWHAGRSKFNGRSNCNGFLLGLSFSGDTNSRELTEAEVKSAVEWLLPRFKEWGWPTDLSTITTHAKISPGRKNDVDSRAYDRIIKELKKNL
jgi:AmpD protein